VNISSIVALSTTSDPSQFGVSGFTAVFNLAPGAQQSGTGMFKPSATGVQSATLQIGATIQSSLSSRWAGRVRPRGCGTPGELRSNAATITVQPTAPEFFFFAVNPDGRNPIQAVDSITGAYIGAAGLLTGATTTPAHVNEGVSLYGTSFGGTDPPILPGAFPDGIAPVAAPVTVTLGGVAMPPADILYAGATQGSPGLFQLDMIVPPWTPDGDLSVVLTIGGVASPPGAYLTVKSEQWAAWIGEAAPLVCQVPPVS